MRTWTVNLALIVVLLMVGSWLHDQNTKANRVLCTFRQDLNQRQTEDQHTVKRSLQYLSDVRSGRRHAIKGITSQDILRGIQDKQDAIQSRQDTMDAIDAELDCTTT